MSMNCQKDHESDLISVIVPIYNVESYLERCIDSIISQTYKNIEIILVDDGSPDRCGEICDLYTGKDCRIKVIHKENGGLSDARNRGAQKAAGAYITFIDSDDFIAPEYIEYLYELLCSNNADISCCCMCETDKDTIKPYQNKAMTNIKVLTGIEACKGLLGYLHLTLVTACGKLYKTEIVKKYPFPKGRKHEDEATTCKYYYESDTVVVGNKCMYAYYNNPTSIMRSQSKGLNLDAIWAFEHRARFFEEQGERALTQLSWRKYFYYCVEDSLKNSYRCDVYLKDFENDKDLSKRIIFESRLYNCSRCLFRVYLKCVAILGSIKGKVTQYK